MLCITTNASSYDLEINGIYYVYHSHYEVNIGMVRDGLEVTFGETPYAGDIVIPSSVTYGDTEYPVVSIGICAFTSNKQLHSVKLPETIISIENSAFLECTSIESIEIPNSVVSIKQKAFWGCDGLKSITIGNAVREVGEGAFTNCKALEKVIIHSIENWCQIVWAREYSTSTIFYCSQPLHYAHRLYLENNEIRNLTIPTSIKAINYHAFYGCQSLESVTIQNSLTADKTIGEEAFSGCNNIVSFDMGESVVELGRRCFSNCIRLQRIIIPKSVVSIDEGAFYGCI